MVFLLFLLPITDSIIPETPTIGTFYSNFNAGFLIENRFQIKELTGGSFALWGDGYNMSIYGYGLGPLKIYRLRAGHGTKLWKGLSIGAGLSGHIYQLDDANGHSAYGIDFGISYHHPLVAVDLFGLDINRPKLTSFDEINPQFVSSITLGQVPQIQFELRYFEFTSLYTGFSIPVAKPLSLNIGFSNRPWELHFALAINKNFKCLYSGSIHERLGLSHRIGIGI